MALQHWAVFLSDTADKHHFINQIMEQRADGHFTAFNSASGMLFSDYLAAELIAEEERHMQVEVATSINRSFRTLSGGERKKALLDYCLRQQPGFLLLDNPFDNLDTASQHMLREKLGETAAAIPVIQLISRKADVLLFIEQAAELQAGHSIIYYESVRHYLAQHNTPNEVQVAAPPPATNTVTPAIDVLVAFNGVSVSYEDHPVVQDIHWQIRAGEFWQLKGANGAGKSTLLGLITGDNPKGYGQDLVLFGRKKGSGESVWDIKQKTGYFTPAMTDLFSRHDTLESMVLGGFYDTVGLYDRPGTHERRVVHEWLRIVQLDAKKKTLFWKLSPGQQRLGMILRAMVKHPPLLILDEPTAGLDDHNVMLVVSLVNYIAAEGKTAIIYVSHREEPGLQPQFVYALEKGPGGSAGRKLEIDRSGF